MDEVGQGQKQSCATRRFGPRSHNSAWPKKLLRHFNLDAIRPAETEFDTWLFGGPVLDYAVTQDRDALKVSPTSDSHLP